MTKFGNFIEHNLKKKKKLKCIGHTRNDWMDTLVEPECFYSQKYPSHGKTYKTNIQVH